MSTPAKETTLKEDVKDVSLSLVYDFLLVAMIFSWLFAILFVLIEVSLWIVFGFFLLGFGFLTGVMWFNRKYAEDEEQAKLAVEETTVELEITEEEDKQKQEESKKSEE